MARQQRTKKKELTEDALPEQGREVDDGFFCWIGFAKIGELLSPVCGREIRYELRLSNVRWGFVYQL